MTARKIQQRLRRLADPEKAKVLRRFFKTGPGEYGEGDRFHGIMVPHIRAVAREFRGAPLAEVRKLLPSPVHEERLLALLLLVDAFERGDDRRKRETYRLYLKSARHINNWDLVDLTAPKIVGPFLEEKSRRPLYRFAQSKNLWERRIAVLSTFHFIKNRDYTDALAVAEMLLDDEEDLIHKAVGWMLREVGKRDSAALEKFLRKHHPSMPRTMLRYAIERFPEAKRRRYLNGTI